MASDIKAAQSYHVEDVEHSPSPNKHDELSLDEVAPDEEKHILRKIDRRLVPLLGACYVSSQPVILISLSLTTTQCISLLDRTNLSAAAIAGMSSSFRVIRVLF